MAGGSLGFLEGRAEMLTKQDRERIYTYLLERGTDRSDQARQRLADALSSMAHADDFERGVLVVIRIANLCETISYQVREACSIALAWHAARESR